MFWAKGVDRLIDRPGRRRFRRGWPALPPPDQVDDIGVHAVFISFPKLGHFGSWQQR